MDNAHSKRYVQDLVEKLAFPVICLIFIIMFYNSSKGLRYESLIYPRIIMTALLFFVVINVGGTVWQWRKTVKAGADPGVRPLWQKKYRAGLIVFGSTFLYVVLMPILGFMLSTAIYLVTMFYALGVRKIHQIILVGCLIFAFLYGAFIFWLKVPLPGGILFQ